jgi:hypothetical protein
LLESAGRTVLEGGKQGKDMFDKGELAAILRFGAQNLFQGEETNEDGVTAPTAETQQRDQQLYEEDIDAILARAEVVDQRVQVSTSQLLLATFERAIVQPEKISLECA